MKKSTQEDSKINNRRLILHTIYKECEISRVDVSRQTGLTRTTVSDVVGKFIDEGLVVETGISPSKGGRPSILLRVESDARHLIGIDLANSEFRGAIVNLRGEIRHRMLLPIQDRDGDAALELVYRLIDQLMEKAQRPISGIGIGAPGLMDQRQGIVRNAVNLDWHDLPLVDLLRNRFNLPIYLANDSQAAALAEFSFGECGPHTNLVVVMVGRGVGAGIVLNGSLFYGDNSSSGEIGHTKVVEHGDRCRCGNTGCLETVISSRALIQKAREIARHQPECILNKIVSSPNDITTEVLFQAYQAGDPAIRDLVAQAGDYLGLALTHLSSALNVNHIVIAGSMARFGEGILQPVRQRIHGGILPELAMKTTIRTSSLQNDIVILGAASLVLSKELGLI